MFHNTMTISNHKRWRFVWNLGSYIFMSQSCPVHWHSIICQIVRVSRNLNKFGLSFDFDLMVNLNYINNHKIYMCSEPIERVRCKFSLMSKFYDKYSLAIVYELNLNSNTSQYSNLKTMKINDSKSLKCF